MKLTSIGWCDPRTEPGELLWTAVPQQMKQAFANFPPRLEAGQLQQRPVPEGGAMFHRDWFKTVPELPRGAKVAVRYWDKAATDGGGDYSVGVLIVEYDGLWYVADVVRGQWSTFQRNSIIRQTAQLDNQRFDNCVTVVEQEPGSGGKESATFTIHKLAGMRVRADKVTGTKAARAQPFADQCEAGHVFLVRGKWNTRFVEELCVFPAGDYDDQVDASSGAFAWCLKTPKYEAPSSATGYHNDPRRYGVLLDPSVPIWWRRN